MHGPIAETAQDNVMMETGGMTMRSDYDNVDLFSWTTEHCRTYPFMKNSGQCGGFCPGTFRGNDPSNTDKGAKYDERRKKITGKRI